MKIYWKFFILKTQEFEYDFFVYEITGGFFFKWNFSFKEIFTFGLREKQLKNLEKSSSFFRLS